MSDHKGVFSGGVRGISFEPQKSNFEKLIKSLKRRFKSGYWTGEAVRKIDVKLEHDPNNKYDNKAIKVIMEYDGDEYFVGHVPKGTNVKCLELGISNLSVCVDGFNLFESRAVGVDICIRRR